MIVISLGLIVKLFSIQVADETYAQRAEISLIKKVKEYPYRGLIYDRHGELLVYNSPIFDLMVTPVDVWGLDTMAFCQMLGIDRATFNKRMRAAKKFSSIRASVFEKQISNEQYAAMADQMVKYPGFAVQARTVRNYTYPSLANSLGYIGEINQRQLDADTTSYYQQGDYIGISGLEGQYEDSLRGKVGMSYRIRDSRGVDRGSYSNGQLDVPSEPGQALISTIDIDLQRYAEKLLAGKVGSVVAIEPATGEVLSIVSAPSYDPVMLSGRSFGSNFEALRKDTAKPLFNRPLMAHYRPGSIFKLAQSLVALQEGVITPQTRIRCNRDLIGCHGPHTNEDLIGAITHSCNPYFVGTMRRVVLQRQSTNVYTDTKMGLSHWYEVMSTMGFGRTLGIDLPNEKWGLLPNVNYYNRAYSGESWKYSNIMSIAIGEGENLVVPLQMANFAAIMANRGYYYAPHLVKGIGTAGRKPAEYLEKRSIPIDSQHFEVVVEAMSQVVKYGTGRFRAKLDSIEVCGKTGTVQNKNTPDHSVFIAFAPRDNPQIALSVYVENGDQGSRAAAAITGLLIEQYLLGSTRRPWMEEYVLKGDFFD